VCYDFKEKTIAPTHCAIRMYDGYPDNCCRKLWLVDTSADGEGGQVVGREENNKQFNRHWRTGTFAVAGGGECRHREGAVPVRPAPRT
jgi:hypothetical protein